MEAEYASFSGCYLRLDTVSRVLKTWRWWSKHKAWILYSCIVDGGLGKGMKGGLNGNLPNLLTLLCLRGGTRGTWLRLHSGIIKAQSLNIQHMVHIPPIFTRAWWRPLSKAHNEMQCLLLELEYLFSPLCPLLAHRFHSTASLMLCILRNTKSSKITEHSSDTPYSALVGCSIYSIVISDSCSRHLWIWCEQLLI